MTTATKNVADTNLVGLTNQATNVIDFLMNQRDEYQALVDSSNKTLYNILGWVYDIEVVLHSDGEHEHFPKISADYKEVMKRKSIQKKYGVSKFDDKKEFSETDVITPILKLLFADKTKRSRCKKVIEFAKLSDKVKDGSYMNGFITELGGIDKASRSANLHNAENQVNKIDEGIKLIAKNNFGVINSKDIAEHIDVSKATVEGYVAVLVKKNKNGDYVIKSATNRKSICESLLSTYYASHKNDDKAVNDLTEEQSKEIKAKNKALNSEHHWTYFMAA